MQPKTKYVSHFEENDRDDGMSNPTLSTIDSGLRCRCQWLVGQLTLWCWVGRPRLPGAGLHGSSR